MKTLSKVISLLFLTTVCVFLASCNHDNEVAPLPNGRTRTQTNQAEYQRLINARQQHAGVSFEISEVKREGDVLTINVKGGCSAEGFKVVWDGIIMKSYPMQTSLLVSYDGDGSCTTPGEYSLKVDLKALMGAGVNPSEFNLHVANGSKVKDVVVDPDGVVSNR